MTEPSQPSAASYVPGTRVEVTQQVPRQNEVFHARIQGVVVRFEQKKTGSWYAHAKDDKLWLDRLTVRKDDGEVVVFNLDPLTHVEVIPAEIAPGAAAEGVPAGDN